jgi:hypothetical protein
MGLLGVLIRGWVGQRGRQKSGGKEFVSGAERRIITVR